MLDFLRRVLIVSQVDFVLSPAAAYNVDILHSRSAEVSAANMYALLPLRHSNITPYVIFRAFRGTFIAASSAAILPLIDSIGVLAAYAIVATACWMGSVYVLTQSDLTAKLTISLNLFLQLHLRRYSVWRQDESVPRYWVFRERIMTLSC